MDVKSSLRNESQRSIWAARNPFSLNAETIGKGIFGGDSTETARVKPHFLRLNSTGESPTDDSVYVGNVNRKMNFRNRARSRSDTSLMGSPHAFSGTKGVPLAGEYPLIQGLTGTNSLPKNFHGGNKMNTYPNYYNTSMPYGNPQEQFGYPCHNFPYQYPPQFPNTCAGLYHPMNNNRTIPPNRLMTGSLPGTLHLHQPVGATTNTTASVLGRPQVTTMVPQANGQIHMAMVTSVFLPGLSDQFSKIEISPTCSTETKTAMNHTPLRKQPKYSNKQFKQMHGRHPDSGCTPDCDTKLNNQPLQNRHSGNSSDKTIQGSQCGHSSRSQPGSQKNDMAPHSVVAANRPQPPQAVCHQGTGVSGKRGQHQSSINHDKFKDCDSARCDVGSLASDSESVPNQGKCGSIKDDSHDTCVPKKPEQCERFNQKSAVIGTGDKCQGNKCDFKKNRRHCARFHCTVHSLSQSPEVAHRVSPVDLSGSPTSISINLDFSHSPDGKSNKVFHFQGRATSTPKSTIPEDNTCHEQNTDDSATPKKKKCRPSMKKRQRLKRQKEMAKALNNENPKENNTKKAKTGNKSQVEVVEGRATSKPIDISPAASRDTAFQGVAFLIGTPSDDDSGTDENICSSPLQFKQSFAFVIDGSEFSDFDEDDGAERELSPEEQELWESFQINCDPLHSLQLTLNCGGAKPTISKSVSSPELSPNCKLDYFNRQWGICNSRSTATSYTPSKKVCIHIAIHIVTP